MDFSIDINALMIYIIEVSVVLLIGMLIYKLATQDSEKQNKLVKKQALTDQLTGRGNRYMFISVLDTLILKKKKFAICFMDLDGFKQVNDTMGHDAGDELLISLANTLEKKLPDNSTAYRLGGDEFALIIQDIKTTQDVTSILDNLKMEFIVPFNIENTNITLEYSLGIAMYPEDANNRQDLIMYADDAMYYIKEHGKNDYYFHNKALRAQIENNNKMEKDLKIAYEKEQFALSLQPRINLKNTNKLCLEALLYWKHPVLGKITSGYFIKQAEEMALIIKLDQYILNRVCDKIVELKEKGFKNLQVAVNISNKHVVKKDFINKLCDIIMSHNLKPGELQIEFTNNIEINKIESYKLLLDRLKECGADIVLKNMEIKYDSLSLFKELQIDELKLSAEYVSKESKLKSDILKNVIKLCNNMNYLVTVGNIETQDELIGAIKSGTDKIQGNFLFKRIEEYDVEDFLRRYKDYKERIDIIITNAKKK
ncbi:MAG: diguanylate cyclase [Clostridia bacterium]